MADEPCPECGIKPIRSKQTGEVLISCGGHLVLTPEFVSGISNAEKEEA